MTGKNIVTANFRCPSQKRTDAKIKAMRQGKAFQDVMNELLDFYISGEFDAAIADRELVKGKELTTDFLK